MNFVDWVRHNFNDLQVLRASTFQYKPGVLLNNHQELTATVATLLEEDPTAPFWQTEQGEAIIFDDQFEESGEGGLKLKVPGLFSINLSHDHAVTASFTASNVQVRAFTNATVQMINKKLHEVVKPRHNRDWIDFVDNHDVVVETWYATKIQAKFKSSGGFMADAEVEAKATISGNRKWVNNETVEFVGSGTVPFGVRAFKP